MSSVPLTQAGRNPAESDYIILHRGTVRIVRPGEYLHDAILRESLARPLNYDCILRLPQVVRDSTPNQIGCAIEYSPTGGPCWWHPIAFYGTVREAQEAFAQIANGCGGKDRNVDHYRIFASPDVGSSGISAQGVVR